MEFLESWPAEKPLQRAGTYRVSCQSRLGVGSILVLIFPPKTKALAIPRHNLSMKRTQKYLWRPSGLGLAVERMKDSNRPKGIFKLAEESRHSSMVMGSVGELDQRRESGEF